jgi:hypothetical protein
LFPPFMIPCSLFLCLIMWSKLWVTVTIVPLRIQESHFNFPPYSS